MNILLVTNLTPKWAGNQSLLNTLNGLAEAGHTIHVLTIRPPGGAPPAYALHPNVHLHVRATMPAWARKLWIPARKGMQRLERLLSRSRSARASDDAQVAPMMGEKAYRPAAPESRTLILTSKLAWVLFQLRAVAAGARLMRKASIDLLYGYEYFGAPAARVLARAAKKPLVTRFQGTLLHPIIEKGSHRDRFAFYEHIVALRTKADLVIMGNDGTRGDEVLRRLGVPKERILFPSNGVNFALYDPTLDPAQLKAELKLPQDAPLILTLSKLDYWKRVDRTVRALPRVLEAHPDAQLVVVGDGTQRGALEALAEHLGVREHVRFVGAVPHSQVRAYLHAADVFVSAYDLSNRGNPLYEAMACARVVVTLADGSVDDLVDANTGRAVDPSRVNSELPRALVEILDDPALRARLGKTARERAMKVLLSVEDRMRLEASAIERVVEHRRDR